MIGGGRSPDLRVCRFGLAQPVAGTGGRGSIGCVKKSFVSAGKKAGIEDFTFHDLRHTFSNNRRQEGHDYFRIMAATGHKPMEVFKRYHTVSTEELKALVGAKK